MISQSNRTDYFLISILTNKNPIKQNLMNHQMKKVACYYHKHSPVLNINKKKNQMYLVQNWIKYI
jgi:hypothetical protein